MAFAVRALTQVVRVRFGTSLRPAGGHGLIAVTAEQEAAQREGLVQIGPRRKLGSAVQALLYLLEGCEIDKRFMLPTAQRNVPRRMFDVACINDAGEHLLDPLIADRTVRQAFGESRLSFEEAFDLGLSLKMT
ncbi:hypothetical protein MTR66_05395 [Novosphingobium sp. 2638]|uniref:Uncharacterized protein n=1 Tax=Novosphingobium beihaiensis TaxID=2930389 RepID=A0ABT0BMH1_9SPHN|nr:hypothetical protein [Novosphingobium beihaiensis]MCJ2186250.1 hypothetical protein [Novosphingobium beihaiensis]